MVITSINFLAFVICTVIFFLIFPPKYRWISLLISSVAFFLISVDNKFIILFIIATSAIAWLFTLKINDIKEKGNKKIEETNPGREEKMQIKRQITADSKKWLVAALVLILGILIAFKVLGLFNESIAHMISVIKGDETFDSLAIIVPLGISYYTFALVGYMLDVYWGRYGAEKNYARLLLFAIYYPHIVQGPISRYPKLGAQLKKQELRLTWDNFVLGMESILIGCFKKLVIADRAAMFVNDVLPNEQAGGGAYLIALILDAIQIYMDFSGYMDIVSGVSKLFDVELEQNFNRPFFAKSVPEFWRRWHMSLGSWFKDYVYYPISVSKTVKKITKKTIKWSNPYLKNVVIVVLPVMVTWLLTGLWHGSGSGYVCWGIYYGLLILLSVTFSEKAHELVGKKINTESFLYRVFQVIKIFCIFMGGRFLASTVSWHQKAHIVKYILTNTLQLEVRGHELSMFSWIILLIGLVVIFTISVVEEKGINIFVWFNKQNRIFCAIVICILFYMVFLFGIYGSGYDASGFMYQQY